MARKGKEEHRPQVHASGNLSDGTRRAMDQIAADEGTERDWRNLITVPRPRIWDERPELIGQQVVPHTCHARVHGDNDGCICEFIGKPVKIIGIYQTHFVGTPSYHIEGSSKRIQEREFSDETKGKDPDTVEGYILEGPEGKFLSAGYVWMPADKPINGYLHNAQVVRDLLQEDWPNGRPVKAYPASSKLDGSQKKITGDPIPFDQLQL